MSAPVASSTPPLGPALIWCPFGDADDAAKVANLLIDEGLVACANILPLMRSLYRWRGERFDELEVGVLFKTDAALLDAAIKRLTDLHPYDTPAILGWKTDAASPSTVNWLGGLVTGGESPA